MTLFGSTKKLIGKIQNGENVLSFEMVEVELGQCNLVDNQYQQKYEVLYTFTPNKSYAYLLTLSVRAPQNAQTHSNNLFTKSRRIVGVCLTVL